MAIPPPDQFRKNCRVGVLPAPDRRETLCNSAAHTVAARSRDGCRLESTASPLSPVPKQKAAVAVRRLRAVTCALLFGLSGPAFAHDRALNPCGCHFNRRTGECHCHRPRGCGCACEPASCGSPLEGPALNEQLPAAACGKERWAVKTLADPEAERVKINSPETTTIEELCALPHSLQIRTSTR